MSGKDSKFGLPPGTLVHTGEWQTEEVTIKIMELLDGQMREYSADSLEDCAPSDAEGATKWIHVNGVHDLSILEQIGNYYNIHPLFLEDIPSTNQRPKMEPMHNGVSIIMRSFDYNKQSSKISSEQVSIVIGEGFVLSFQESPTDMFEPIRNRARRKESRIVMGGSDYLAYTLMDLVVDKYFLVLEQLGDKIEDLEDDLIVDASNEMLTRIYSIKRTLIALRRYIWPMREVILKIQREGPPLIEESSQMYMRDLYDHVVRVMDHIETFRESVTGMLDIYLSSMSNRMNEVMKVLTVISTIFIPLTLMASIYGMNWPWMPELEFFYGYPVFLLAMLFVTIGLIIHFRRIQWL